MRAGATTEIRISLCQTLAKVVSLGSLIIDPVRLHFSNSHSVNSSLEDFFASYQGKKHSDLDTHLNQIEKGWRKL